MKKSELELAFESAFKLYCPYWWNRATQEYQFHPTRKWRLDVAWVNEKVAVEIEGGTFGGKQCPVCKQRKGGGHNTGVGYAKNCEKYNAATACGWRLLRYTGDMLKADAEGVIAQITAVLTEAHLGS